MIDSKTECRWETHSNIAENGKQLIYQDTFMACPMREIMYQYMTGVSDCPSKDINTDQY